MLGFDLYLVIAGHRQIQMLVMVRVERLTIGVNLLDKVDLCVLPVDVYRDMLHDHIVLPDATGIILHAVRGTRMRIIVISLAIIPIRVPVMVKVSITPLFQILGLLPLLLNDLGN
jgi:hypothetical protein